MKTSSSTPDSTFAKVRPGGRIGSNVPGASGGEQTLRELCQRFAASRGHYSIIGTPEDVANEMKRWLENGACDGFNFVPSVYPSGLEDFVTMVIPELQKRGIFRREYEGQTLRDNLGLRRCRISLRESLQ